MSRMSQSSMGCNFPFFGGRSFSSLVHEIMRYWNLKLMGLRGNKIKVFNRKTCFHIFFSQLLNS